jgi:hypothetical protein
MTLRLIPAPADYSPVIGNKIIWEKRGRILLREREDVLVNETEVTLGIKQGSPVHHPDATTKSSTRPV